MKKVKSLKLDLGCGQNVKEGYTGVDIAKVKGVGVVHDLTVTPWPFEDNSVDDIHSAHFFEHLTGVQRISFMEECWRILKPKTQMVIIVPHWSSMRSVQDPFHAWPPVCETSFLYFNKGWRDTNKLDHYPITCDFDFGYGFSLDPDVSVRNNDFVQFASKHYVNAIHDLHVTLTVKK